MNRLRYMEGSALMVATLWAQGVLADGFRNPPDTAASLGLSGNHIVWVDDASAVFLNPANLVNVPSREVQLSSMVGYNHVDYHGQLGVADTERPWGFLPAFAVAWPLSETDFALGFGMHVPFGRQTRWDLSDPMSRVAPVYSEMSVYDFSPSLAWRVSDTVAIGAGPDLYYGQLRFRQLHPLLPSSRLCADADGFAVGGNAGITWDVTGAIVLRNIR